VSVDYRPGEGFGTDYAPARGICDHLVRSGERAVLFNVNDPLEESIARWPGGLVFLQADTFAPVSRNAARYPEPFGVRRALEAEGVPFVGSRYAAVTGSSSGDKAAARERMGAAAVRIPPGRAVDAAADPREEALALAAAPGLPLVLKPRHGSGASRGVVFVETAERLTEAVSRARDAFEGGMVAEAYVQGREFTAWIFEAGGEPEVYGMAELLRPPGTPILSRRLKRFASSSGAPPDAPPADFAHMVLQPRLTPEERAAVCGAAVAAHRALGLRHYSRMDLMLAEGEAVVIDANARPQMVGLNLFAEERGETVAAALTRLVHEARSTA
jgi:D-alanine-D-alanine ligase